MTSSPATDPRIPDIAAIRAAASRIAGQAVLTPLLESPAVNAKLGGRLLVKAEPLQRTGSFKFRGAFNTLSQLDAAERKGGVVTWSSGNHAQGVAAAAQQLGIPALIVMPSDAPAIKIANTKGYGAEVELYDRFGQSREEIGRQIARDRGATIVAPYDEPRVIAGQGTCGLEIAAQAKARNATLDAVLICCGGGGLTAGCAIALAAESPGTPVYAVEPADFNDTGRSLAAGERVSNDPAARSFCDALLAPTPGELTFAINQRLVKAGLAVTDREVAKAMAFAFSQFKLVVEPGGAVALAAVLSGKIDIKGRTIAVVCSGGNVDAETFRKAIAEG
ncbi:MAG: threonine/serine dehydratase [Alphaproteobacteria bacterium]|nr:threonine/serine dehydratase [Alphaproteobacteria bacterium]